MKKRVRRHAVVQPLDQSYRIIPLTRGQNAIVDAADYEWLNQRTWHAFYNKSGHSFYAVTNDPKPNGKGYKELRMHRLILGCGPKEQGDHKNRNTLDNRRENLRKCTPLQNVMNRRTQRNSTSGFKGVFPHGAKWRAMIRVRGQLVRLGNFVSKEEAAHAYDEAAKKHFGEFAHTNFPL